MTRQVVGHHPKIVQLYPFDFYDEATIIWRTPPILGKWPRVPIAVAASFHEGQIMVEVATWPLNHIGFDEVVHEKVLLTIRYLGNDDFFHHVVEDVIL